MSSYREVLREPGALAFSATGLVARLPMAMVGLGILLFTSGSTGSYGLAGVMSAAFSLSAAVGMIMSSRLVDRLGQHKVLGWLITGESLGLALFITSMELNWPYALSAALVAGAGACSPAIGPAVRARWTYVISRAESTSSPKLRTAFALESIVEEVIFTVGPLITAWLAISVALPAPIILAIVIGLTGTFLLIRLRGTEPTPSPVHKSHEPHTSAFRHPGIVLMIFAAITTGAIFGSFEVALVAFTAELGAPGLSGPLLAAWASTSMFGGLWFGSRHFRAPLANQLVVITAALTIGLLATPFLSSLFAISLTTMISGALVAPVLITIFSLAERLVPNAQLTEGLTLINSGLTVGFSLGVALGGYVIDGGGAGHGFAVGVSAAAAAFLVACLGQKRLRGAVKDYGPSPPTTALNTEPIPGPAPGSFASDDM
ncbi:MAG: MFS transporter [Candidatus Nanopelagicales bacterium]|nr:MFS transporter [Candidatus Nanopelagicales bacterium]